MHYNLHIKILINKIYFWLKILQTNKYNANDSAYTSRRAESSNDNREYSFHH